MKNFWKNINWTVLIFGFAIATNLFSAGSYAFSGEWGHAFDHGIIAALFILLLVYRRLLENAHRAWDEAMAGWEDSLEGWGRSNTLVRELERKDELYPASDYETYGFQKGDMN